MYRVVLAVALSLTLVLSLVTVPAFAGPPPPPKKTTADCSPGFYKNHPDAWDNGICCDGDALASGTECNGLYQDLNAHGSTSANLRRAAATAELNECFGTAEASPCTDD
jgi:hypothetical protein